MGRRGPANLYFARQSTCVGLELLFRRISGDQKLWESLIPNGYIPFGKGTDIDYDPVCFAIRTRKNRDYRIVKIDHEEIFCNCRIKVVSELAPSFRALVLETIERAGAKRRG
jgi:hypothetical protein